MQDRLACPLFRGRRAGREAPAKPEPNGRAKGPPKPIVPRPERIDRHQSRATLWAGLCPSSWTNRKKRYGGFLPNEMRRLKALEDENVRLKKIVTDLTRKLVDGMLVDWGVSIRRACSCAPITQNAG